MTFINASEERKSIRSGPWSASPVEIFWKCTTSWSLVTMRRQSAEHFFLSGSAFCFVNAFLDDVLGAGFFMRPLGALVLGAYTDRHGRRAGLLLTLAMTVGGDIFNCLARPAYATIGLMAPLLVLIGRLLQGFSAGMELGGVSVYLSEIATPGHKGFYVSWQSGSQQVAVMFAASVWSDTSEFHLLTGGEDAAMGLAGSVSAGLPLYHSVSFSG